MIKVIFENHITREMVKSHPDRTFLFGDNLLQQGYGGQAKEMRGEPNVIGIPTKKKPSMSLDSFFTDDEFESNKESIDKAFSKIPKDSIVVIPQMGLGTGRARLWEKAPKTWIYLCKKIRETGVSASRWCGVGDQIPSQPLGSSRGQTPSPARDKGER